jgi:hypothetical protein
MAASWKDETGNGHFVLSTEEKARYQTASSTRPSRSRTCSPPRRRPPGSSTTSTSPQGPSVGGTDANAARSAPASRASPSASPGSAPTPTGDEGLAVPAPRRRLHDRAGLRASRRSPERKDVYSALGGDITIPVLGQAQSLGWTDRTLRPGRVRDLFPSETHHRVDLSTGSARRATSTVRRRCPSAPPPTVARDRRPDRRLRPQAAVGHHHHAVHVGISTIAHIMYVHRQTLDDEPRMRGILDRDMIDGVKMVEDDSFSTVTASARTSSASPSSRASRPTPVLRQDKRSAQIRRAMTRAILAYFSPRAACFTRSTGKTWSWKRTAPAPTPSRLRSPSVASVACGE